MKKVLLSLLLTTLFLAGVSSCSKDGVTLATYEHNGETYEVTIADVKDDLVYYSKQDFSLASDTVTHKLVVYDVMFPELAYFYMLDQDFTNQEMFLTNFENYGELIRIDSMFDAGYEIVSNEVESLKIPIVRASHILIRPDLPTDADYTDPEAASNAVEQAWSEAQAKATSVLSYLQESDDLDTDFEQQVLDYSEDIGSMYNGGDLGYFTKGQMVPEFEEAVFNQTKDGLVDEVVETVNGYHVIYVTDAPQSVKQDQISNVVGTNTAYGATYLVSLYQGYYFNDVRETNITHHYEINTSTTNAEFPEGSIIIDGVAYASDTIPADAVLIEYFGIPYKWEDFVEIENLSYPGFETNLSISDLSQHLNNFDGYMFFVARAERDGIPNTKAFQERMKENSSENLKNIALSLLAMEWEDELMADVTDEDLESYYDMMEPMGYWSTYQIGDDGQYEQVTLSFEDAYEQVKSDYLYNLRIEKKQLWMPEAEEMFNVQYNDNGLETLKDVLEGELDDYLNSDEYQQTIMSQQQNQLFNEMYTE